MQETQVQSLGQEDPLEKEMATHSSIPAWRIPWTEELGELQSIGSQRVGQTETTEHALVTLNLFTLREHFLFVVIEKNIWPTSAFLSRMNEDFSSFLFHNISLLSSFNLDFCH